MEAAKRRWLFCHRDLFQPLLPSTNFFVVLRKELADTGEKVTYVPFHALWEQPALIQGGEMKDYQVCCSVLLAHVFGKLSCDSYQLQGLAFLVYMYNNGECLYGLEDLAINFGFEGMNCILGDGGSACIYTFLSL